MEPKLVGTNHGSADSSLFPTGASSKYVRNFRRPDYARIKIRAEPPPL